MVERSVGNGAAELPLEIAIVVTSSHSSDFAGRVAQVRFE
jgi:hypothetical protein